MFYYIYSYQSLDLVLFALFYVITSVAMERCHYVLVSFFCGLEKVIGFLPAKFGLIRQNNLPLDLKTACFTWPRLCRGQNLSWSCLEWVKRHLKDLNHLPCSSQVFKYACSSPLVHEGPHGSLHHTQVSSCMVQVQGGESVGKDLARSTHLPVLPAFPSHVYFSGY